MLRLHTVHKHTDTDTYYSDWFFRKLNINFTISSSNPFWRNLRTEGFFSSSSSTNVVNIATAVDCATKHNTVGQSHSIKSTKWKTNLKYKYTQHQLQPMSIRCNFINLDICNIGTGKPISKNIYRSNGILLPQDIENTVRSKCVQINSDFWFLAIQIMILGCIIRWVFEPNMCLCLCSLTRIVAQFSISCSLNSFPQHFHSLSLSLSNLVKLVVNRDLFVQAL